MSSHSKKTLLIELKLDTDGACQARVSFCHALFTSAELSGGLSSTLAHARDASRNVLSAKKEQAIGQQCKTWMAEDSKACFVRKDLDCVLKQTIGVLLSCSYRSQFV